MQRMVQHWARFLCRSPWCGSKTLEPSECNLQSAIWMSSLSCKGHISCDICIRIHCSTLRLIAPVWLWCWYLDPSQFLHVRSEPIHLCRCLPMLPPEENSKNIIQYWIFVVVVLANTLWKPLMWSCKLNCTILCAVLHVFTHLVIETFRESNSKLQWNNGNPSLLPVAVGIKLLDGQTSMGVVRFLETLVPAPYHVMRRKKLLVVGVAFLVLVHVDVSHLYKIYFFALHFKRVEMKTPILSWSDTSNVTSTAQHHKPTVLRFLTFGYLFKFQPIKTLFELFVIKLSLIPPDEQVSHTWWPPHVACSLWWSTLEVHQSHGRLYMKVSKSCTPVHVHVDLESCSHYPCEGELSPLSGCKLQKIQSMWLRDCGNLKG